MSAPEIALHRVPQFVAALELAGCGPVRVGPDRWLAICPSCRDKGRSGLLVIRATAAGLKIFHGEEDPS